jgi:tetratricopeptide (TPR) repeat protein
MWWAGSRLIGLDDQGTLNRLRALRHDLIDPAIAAIEQAIRIAPRNPNMAARYRTMGYPLLALGRYDEAVGWLQRSLAANPQEHAVVRSDTFAKIASAQALAKHPEEARVSG